MDRAVELQRIELLRKLEDLSGYVHTAPALLYRIDAGDALDRRQYASALNLYTPRVMYALSDYSLESAIRHANAVTGFWESPIGQLIARGMVRDLHPLTVSEYAEREGIPVSAASHRAVRGRVMSFPDPDEPNPQKQTRILVDD